MIELELLKNEEPLFKSKRVVQLENNSNQPEKIHQKLGNFWVYLTNLRLAFVPQSGKPIFQAIENIDYYSLIEKKSAFGKNRIRVWIGLTRLDLISDHDNLSDIFDNMKKHIELKLRKGAVIFSSLDGKSTGILELMEKTAKEKNVTVGDLMRNGKITLLKCKIDNQNESSLENEWNWNKLDNGDGTANWVLVPAVDLDKDAIVPSSYNLKFTFEPSLSKHEQRKLKEAISDSELRQEFGRILSDFTDGYEGKGVINEKIKGKRMLVDITLSSPIVCYSRDLEKEIWENLCKKYDKTIYDLFENQTENRFTVKFEGSKCAYGFVLKSQYETTKYSID